MSCHAILRWYFRWCWLRLRLFRWFHWCFIAMMMLMPDASWWLHFADAYWWWSAVIEIAIILMPVITLRWWYYCHYYAAEQYADYFHAYLIADWYFHADIYTDIPIDATPLFIFTLMMLMICCRLSPDDWGSAIYADAASQLPIAAASDYWLRWPQRCHFRCRFDAAGHFRHFRLFSPSRPISHLWYVDIDSRHWYR